MHGLSKCCRRPLFDPRLRSLYSATVAGVLRAIAWFVISIRTHLGLRNAVVIVWFPVDAEDTELLLARTVSLAQ